MVNHRNAWLSALLLGASAFWLTGASVLAGEKKKDEPKKAESFLDKSAELKDDDAKDEKLNKPSKVFKLEMTKGKTYKIDLKSKDFDTFLRLVDATGKEVAFNDDVSPPALDSQIIFRAPKTGEYRIVATCYDGKTGSFTLTVVAASAKEAAAAALAERIENFGKSTPAERKLLLQEVVKNLKDKGEDLTINDARSAFMLSMAVEEADTDLAREAYKDFIKVFEGASNKQVASVTKAFESSLKKLNMIGKAIEVTGKTMEGKDFDLKDLKGKVVLVDFWATWCGPCIAELPNIQRAYAKYHGKGFEVIGVSLDRNDDAITKFQENRKLPWTSINVEDSRKLANKFEVRAIPFPVLIDSEGRVVSLRARGAQLDRLLEKLLGDRK